MANGKKKEARGHVALECTECKENKGLSKENYFVSKNWISIVLLARKIQFTKKRKNNKNI